MNIPEQLAPYAARLGFPGSEAMARILAILFDDPDSVSVAGAMPGSVADISAKTGMSEQRVSQVTHRLLHKGAISRVISKGQYFRLFPAMIELRDAVVITPDCPQELFELWEVIIRDEMPKIVPMMKSLSLPHAQGDPHRRNRGEFHEGSGCRLGPADSPRRIAHYCHPLPVPHPGRARGQDKRLHSTQGCEPVHAD